MAARHLTFNVFLFLKKKKKNSILEVKMSHLIIISSSNVSNSSYKVPSCLISIMVPTLCLFKAEQNIFSFGLILSFSGLQTSQDARFYAASARFDSFSNEGKPLVIQFTVKHEQKIDCGGGYVKVFPADLEQTEMHGESSYYIMFGK